MSCSTAQHGWYCSYRKEKTGVCCFQRLVRRLREGTMKKTVGSLIALLTLCDGATASESKIVRLAVVITPESSELLSDILAEFECQTGYSVDVSSTSTPYDLARAGKADLVLSHYGHAGTEDFVTEGLGLWPSPVFSNQAALLGPPNDPANTHQSPDLVEAFRRIAKTRSLFLVNNASSERYLARTLWEMAGRPDKTDWYIECLDGRCLRDQEAVETAASLGAYTLWGLVPFLRLQESARLELEAQVIDDPLLQRMMVTVRVNPKRIEGMNFEGATALERFFILPETQARVRANRYPGFDHQLWWPAARNNSGMVLEQ
jgi:tungstate transport system substrate-binding protein